jgi:hypothetical protein
MDKSPWNWTKDDLEKLIGQMESLNLEFKDSRLFDASPNRIVDELTKEVSAFANTVGGVLVVGVSEKKDGKSRIADNIGDGVDSKIWYRERLQQIIESNLSPFLSGIRVHMVSIDHQRSIIVIYIPEGNTAYQASDKRYYGRSEFEAKALPDHEIRLRMFKGKSASGSIALIRKNIYQTFIPKNSISSALVMEVLHKENLDQITISRYSFGISVVNTGEVDITGFKLIANINPKTIRRTSSRVYWRYYDGMEADWRDENYDPEFSDKIITVKMYPQDTFVVDGDLICEIPFDVSMKDLNATLDWELFLSNRMPIQGQFDLASEFKDMEITTR